MRSGAMGQGKRHVGVVPYGRSRLKACLASNESLVKKLAHKN